MLYILVPAVVVLIAIIWLVVEYSFLVIPPKGIPILMYHKVSGEKADGLTLPEENLRKQLEYLKDKGYETMFFRELDDAFRTGGRLPSKPVIITFDDAYADFMTHAAPLLRSFGFKSTVFVPVGYMGKTNVWDHGTDRILTANEIRELAMTGSVEFGIHSFLHRNYSGLNGEAIREDLNLCIQTLGSHNIPFVRVLAYPYGGYSRKDPDLRARMKSIFREAQLLYALRIGNRINPLPFRDPYELKRIDIRGTDDFLTFRIKIKKGRRKLFS